MIFEPRTKAPAKDDPNWYSDKNVFTKCGYGMPNCTTYVQGDWLSRYNADTYCRHNAGGWIEEAKEKGKYKISQTPKLGAIAVWKIPGTENNGHVAIVEKIENNADIDTSNSAYKGTEWWRETFRAGFNYNWTSKKTGKKYIFQGFILPPVEQKEQSATLYATAKLQFRSEARYGKKLGYIEKGGEFYYDGHYYVVAGTKWLRGIYNSELGWVSARYMKLD